MKTSQSGTPKTIPTRDEVKKQDTWDLSPLYKDHESWRKDKENIESKLDSILKFKGQTTTTPETLKEVLDLHFSIYEKLEDLYTFAHLTNDQDTTNSKGNAMLQEAQSLWVQYSTKSSFIAPELTSLDEARFNQLLSDPTLKIYKMFLQEIERRKAHTRKESEEELLSLAGEVLSSSSKVFRQLTDADLSFEDVEVDGSPLPLSHSTYINFLLNPNRDVRKKAFENYYKSYESHRFSLAAIFQSNLKKDTFIARARGHASSKALGLFGDNIPEAVHDTLVDEISKGLGDSLHTYYKLRKQIFNFDEQFIYDTYVPLIKNPPKGFPYDEGVELLIEALAPLGEEYTQTLRKGLTDSRWVDRYENKGKRSGAYSSGTYNSPPYILMNYKEDSIESLYTLAHEAGHSMHTFLANKTQDYQNHSYTIFVAEVASTLNELLLTKYLLQKFKDSKDFCAYILNYQLDAIKGTFFRQTMFAEFEDATHSASDRNEPLTIESFRAIYRTLLEKYFGDNVRIGELDDLECLRIPHFYSSFYVFKYATGISASIALAEKIYAGDAESKKKYLNFLSSGGSKYSLDLLKDAGADLTKPEPFKATIQVFKNTLQELCHVMDWKHP